MKYLIFLFLTGCVSQVHGPYLHESIQDGPCYARYGAELGYCEKD